MTMLNYLIVGSLLACLLYFARFTMRFRMWRLHFKHVYWTQEWYDARIQLCKWIAEGRLPPMDWDQQRQLLKQLCHCYSVQQSRNRLVMLAGPNGWAVYNMILKQRSWVAKIIS